MDSFKKRPINQAFKRNTNEGIVIGNVNVKNIGKSSLQISNNEFIIKSLKTNYVFNQPIDKVDYLAYSKGNFFIDEKIYMGINGEQFEITCKEDEYQFKNFFDTIKRIKNSKLKNHNILEQNTSNSHELPETDNNTDEKTNSNIEYSEESKISPSEEIRNFHNLMKEGIISEEEFEEKKKELLKL